VFVNGRKTERSRIRDGDVIKLGDVVVTLLPETSSGTVVMEELDGMGARAARRGEPEVERTVPEVPPSALPPSAFPPSGPQTPAARRPPITAAFRAVEAAADAPVDAAELLSAGAGGPRPLTVAVLAALWALSIPLYAVGAFAIAWQARGLGRAALVLTGLALALLSAAMAIGLWQARRWAYVAQIVVAVLGLFLCPFTLASIAVLVYMLRPAARWHFSDRREREPHGVGQAEPMFAGALVGAVVLGVFLTATLTFLARTARSVAGGPRRLLMRTPAAETAALAQLKALAAAEDAFHSVCNTGYGDLEALRQPARVIPDYPANGPAFLRGPAFDQPERDGYRYTLTVEDEMPPAAGCPTRRFRRFLYSATALGRGRSLIVGPDGVVRAAEGRPATPDDPAAQ
jgi:hypothetical protein